MTDTDPEHVLGRWPRAVREGGHAEAADVLEGWMARETRGLGPLTGPSRLETLDAGSLPGAAGEAFARLGQVSRAEGLDLDALHAVLRALGEAVTGRGAGPGVDALHGVAVGGWHARAAAPADAVADGAAGESPGDGRDGLAGLDPTLRKLIRHDIKTPLQAASLNLELLAMEQEDNPDVTAAITTIMESLDSAVEMLRRFDEV